MVSFHSQVVTYYILTVVELSVKGETYAAHLPTQITLVVQPLGKTA